MSSAAKTLLGTAGYSEAQVLKRKLEAHEIEVALIHNQQTCGGGCSVKLEIWSHENDVAAIGQILADERGRELLDMGYDPRLANEVFDPTRAEATCPACGTGFSTSTRECPECGLCFELPEDAPAPQAGCGSC